MPHLLTLLCHMFFAFPSFVWPNQEFRISVAIAYQNKKLLSPIFLLEEPVSFCTSVNTLSSLSHLSFLYAYEKFLSPFFPFMHMEKFCHLSFLLCISRSLCRLLSFYAYEEVCLVSCLAFTFPLFSLDISPGRRVDGLPEGMKLYEILPLLDEVINFSDSWEIPYRSNIP